MSQVKTITTTSGENTVAFDAFYPYIWIRNTGDSDITAANYSGAQAGDENTVSIKAGEVAMIQAETENVYIIGATTAEIHAQGFAECPFKRGLGGGEQISVESLSVTANGTYTAPTGTAYSPVVVDVQEQPWQPLQDGYSNFWLELTDDTLSPWLNFSAKNADAVIDWGDGSGEQPLDTLTPTHTYAKAGRYVVKCKGVTEISQQIFPPLSNTGYQYCIKYIELNSELTSFGQYTFQYCVGLRKITFSDAITVFSNANFRGCASLHTAITLPASLVTVSGQMFYFCFGLQEVIIKSNVSSIEGYAFGYCANLTTIHIQATTPPTIGNYIFTGLPTNYVIYVPTGTGDTYKAASGWSAYADHILEEGQTVTRAMQRKFAKEAKVIEEDTGDMR